MGFEMEGEGVPSYLQPDNEPDYEELNLPSAPCGHAVPARRVNNQVSSFLSILDPFMDSGSTGLYLASGGSNG